MALIGYGRLDGVGSVIFELLRFRSRLLFIGLDIRLNTGVLLVTF